MNWDGVSVDDAALRLLPIETCIKYTVVPISRPERTAELLMRGEHVTAALGRPGPGELRRAAVADGMIPLTAQDRPRMGLPAKSGGRRPHRLARRQRSLRFDTTGLEAPGFETGNGGLQISLGCLSR